MTMLTQESRAKLKTLLVRHESYKQFPYQDTTGHLTIGIGRNLDEKGISTTEAFYLLDEDILYFTSKLSANLPFFDDLNDARKIALVDMCFNLGVKGLLGFKKMIDALANKNYQRAAFEMLNSKWAEQVGQRAEVLSDIVRTGNI